MFAAPGHAASLNEPKFAPLPQPAPRTVWTGVYAGIHGAFAGQEASFGGGLAKFNSPSTSTGTYGLQAGAQVQLGRIVGGVEIDYARSVGDDSDTRHSALTSLTYNSETTQLASARLRVGVAEGDVLAYVTVGGAWMETDFSIKTTGGRVIDAPGTSEFGVVYGGGIDWRVMPQASIRAEILHYDFDTNLKTKAGERFDVDLGTTLVKTGVNFHF
jgi:outer membrane immunogenic protein